MLIRIGVAVGEAGCIPTAHSLIADYFDRAKRPRAIGIYMLGGSLSVVLGYWASGWLNQYYGWRITFMVVGLPGVVLALVARFTIREPRLFGSAMRAARPHADQPTAHIAPAPSQPALGEVCLTLWSSVTFRHLLMCISVFYFFATGIQQWQPAFFIRSYGLNTGEMGSWFAVVYGLTSLLGTYWGGSLSSRYAPNNEALQLKAWAIMGCAFALTSALVYLTRSAHVAFVLLGVATLLGGLGNGPLFATIQTLVPVRMRSTSVAIIYLSANLIGVGLGPLAVGMLSDALRPDFGAESLRYALLLLCPGYLWGSWHLWRASRTVTRELAAIQKDGGPGGQESSNLQGPAGNSVA